MNKIVLNTVHLGSSTIISDATGKPVQHIEYTAFGESFADWRTEDWTASYRFTGKVMDADRSVSKQDAETGLYYYGARYYDPFIGRFLSVDPLAEKYGAWSPYNYVYNNPLKYVDPTGMEGESIHEDAYGNRIVEIKDGDNNVYRHNDLGKDGQHIDGMIAKVKQDWEAYGASAGGEKQFVKSTINKISNFFKDGKQQQHQGDNLVIYWNGSQNGWSIVGDRPNSKGAKESIDMTKFVLPNGPSNDILGFATFNEQVNHAVGNVKNGKDDTKAYEKYKGDPANDPSLKLDSITHARNNTIEHRSPKNKK